MKPVYIDSTEAEKTCKAHFFFPECVMMENAAVALEKAVLEENKGQCDFSVLIVCGGGNNGADGLTLARRLVGAVDVTVILLKTPGTPEAEIQLKMAKACRVKIVKKTNALAVIKEKKWSAVVDCIYGTGFRGSLDQETKSLIDELNALKCAKIACDIPSALAFKADKTVTMGSLKSILYGDEAKDFIGEVRVADLGISSFKFCSVQEPDAWLLEKGDIKLPYRTKQNVNKGSFGQSAVILGEKAGAGIIAGTAALKAGSGYSSLVVGVNTCYKDFKMNPELLQSEEIPLKTTAILLGSGLGRDFENPDTKAAVEKAITYIKDNPECACVLDADIFYSPQIKEILGELNSLKRKVVLTPHPKELHQLLQSCTSSEWDLNYVIKNRFEVCHMFRQVYPNIVLIAKGANTFIANGQGFYIFDKGTSALAKAGSGDVLAGLCTGLLAQGYDSLEAGIASVWLHGTSCKKLGFDFSGTPGDFIDGVECL